MEYSAILVEGASRFLDDILSVLLPRSCPLCRDSVLKRGQAFCPSCILSFQLFESPICSRCGVPIPCKTSEPGVLCTACLVRAKSLLPNLTVRSLGPYSGNLRDALLRLKYGRQLLLAPSLGRLLADRFRGLFPSGTFDTVLPVPLHPNRLREREFNQSLLLAKPLARTLKVPLDLHSLVRLRNTPSQSLFKGPERRKNLKGAFRIQEAEAIRGKSVLVVDDVYTTGATAEEISGLLLIAGANHVAVLTVAKSMEMGSTGQARSPGAKQDRPEIGLDTPDPLD